MKKYSVKEIDDLREVCRLRMVWGSTDTECTKERTVYGRGLKTDELIRCIEEMARTYMIAGIKAEDVIKADKE